MLQFSTISNTETTSVIKSVDLIRRRGAPGHIVPPRDFANRPEQLKVKTPTITLLPLTLESPSTLVAPKEYSPIIIEHPNKITPPHSEMFAVPGIQMMIYIVCSKCTISFIEFIYTFSVHTFVWKCHTNYTHSRNRT